MEYSELIPGVMIKLTDAEIRRCRLTYGDEDDSSERNLVMLVTKVYVDDAEVIWSDGCVCRYTKLWLCDRRFFEKIDL